MSKKHFVLAWYPRKKRRVIPLYGIKDGRCACGRADCPSPGKHPRIRNWRTDASSDPHQLERWLQQYTDMNIGAVTGEEVFVIDIDGEAGENSLALLVAQNGELPDTLTVTTGRGRHLYFLCCGLRIKCSKGALGRKVDVRGYGAYVVAPWSIHVTGAEYQFVNEQVPIANAPEWLLALVCEDVQIQQAHGHERGEHIIEEGHRNQTLFEHACSLRGAGACQEQIEHELAAINNEFCAPPLETSEITQIASSAAKYSPNSPANGPITGNANALRWFPFDTTAWRRNHNVFTMRDSQVGWYVWLIVEAWDRAGSLPCDPAVLAKLARASNLKRFYNEMPIVLAEFELSEDQSNLIHPGLRAEYLQRMQKVEKKREAGLKRWEQKTKATVEKQNVPTPTEIGVAQ